MNKKPTFNNFYARLGKMVKFLATHERFTRAEFEAAVGLKKTATGRVLRTLWRPGPDRCIRICDWLDDSMGRPTVRVYEFGTAPDVKRRPPMTCKEREIRRQEKKERLAQITAQQAILAMARPSKSTC